MTGSGQYCNPTAAPNHRGAPRLVNQKIQAQKPKSSMYRDEGLLGDKGTSWKRKWKILHEKIYIYIYIRVTVGNTEIGNILYREYVPLFPTLHQ